MALRFYKHDGWAKEHLEPYLERGRLIDTTELFGDEPDWAYFTLDTGSRLNVKKLLEEQVSKVHRNFDDYPNESDLLFMERYNW